MIDTASRNGSHLPGQRQCARDRRGRRYRDSSRQTHAHPLALGRLTFTLGACELSRSCPRRRRVTRASASCVSPQLCTPETRVRRAPCSRRCGRRRGPAAQHPEIYGHYPVIELVTMGIGWPDLGAPRPHRAVRSLRRTRARTTCYNYGIGDFHHPIGMACGFFRGTHSFWVGKMEPDNMLGDLPVRRSHDLGAAAAARPTSRSSKVIAQARVRHPRRAQALRVRPLLGQLHDARARHPRQRDRRRAHGDARARPTADLSRPRARGLLRHAHPADHHRHRDGPRHRSRADVLGADVPARLPARGARSRRGTSSRSRSTSARDRRRSTDGTERPRRGSRCSSCAADRARVGDAAVGPVPAHRPGGRGAAVRAARHRSSGSSRSSARCRTCGGTRAASCSCRRTSCSSGSCRRSAARSTRGSASACSRSMAALLLVNVLKQPIWPRCCGRSSRTRSSGSGHRAEPAPPPRNPRRSRARPRERARVSSAGDRDPAAQQPHDDP